MQRRGRIGLLALAAVVVVAGFVIAVSSGGSGKHRPRVRNVKVVVAGCKPQGGIKRIDVNQGDTVNLTVSSDCGDEIHIHGYNYKLEVAPHGSVGFGFKATITGTFVIELERRSEQIASLRVNL